MRAGVNPGTDAASAVGVRAGFHLAVVIRAHDGLDVGLQLHEGFRTGFVESLLAAHACEVGDPFDEIVYSERASNFLNAA